jgi:hypothetical protein
MAQKTQGAIAAVGTATAATKAITGITAANPPVVTLDRARLRERRSRLHRQRRRHDAGQQAALRRREPGREHVRAEGHRRHGVHGVHVRRHRGEEDDDHDRRVQGASAPASTAKRPSSRRRTCSRSEGIPARPWPTAETSRSQSTFRPRPTRVSRASRRCAKAARSRRSRSRCRAARCSRSWAR